MESRRGNDGKVSMLVSDEAVAEQRLGDDQAASEQRLDRDQAGATESRLRLDLDEAQGRLVEELRAMLAEARRPWWRRWM